MPKKSTAAQAGDRLAALAAKKEQAIKEATKARAERMQALRRQQEWENAWQALAGPVDDPHGCSSFDAEFLRLPAKEKLARIRKVAAVCRKYGHADTVNAINERLWAWLAKFDAGERYRWPMVSLLPMSRESLPVDLLREIAAAAEALVRAIKKQSPIATGGLAIAAITIPSAWDNLWREIVRAPDLPIEPQPIRHSIRCGNGHGTIELDSPPESPFRCPLCEAEKQDAIAGFVYRVGHATGEVQVPHSHDPEMQAKTADLSAAFVASVFGAGLCAASDSPEQAAKAVIVWAIATHALSRRTVLNCSLDEIQELLLDSAAPIPDVPQDTGGQVDAVCEGNEVARKVKRKAGRPRKFDDKELSEMMAYRQDYESGLRSGNKLGKWLRDKGIDRKEHERRLTNTTPSKMSRRNSRTNTAEQSPVKGH